MRNIDRYFVALGVLAALCGMSMGIWMDARGSYALMQVHAHTNLVGWVTLSLYGLGYRSGIARKDGWALVHFYVSLAAILALPSGMILAMTGGTPNLAYAGSGLAFASMALFGINVLRAFVPEGEPRRVRA